MQLNDLLELKQKQANVSEARSGRKQAEQATLQAKLQAAQAEATTRQGTSIMLASNLKLQDKNYGKLTRSEVHNCDDSLRKSHSHPTLCDPK